MYVRAAELKDIEGLKDREIGKRLGVGQSRSEKDGGRRDFSNVRRHYREGGRLLDVVHMGCWEEYATAQKRPAGLE